MIKKLLSIAAVMAMPLFAANAQESVEKVVLEEDFSLMTAGEFGAPDTETVIVNEDGTIKTEYIHKAGWKATKAYSAGGYIYCPSGSDGRLYTPTLDLSASVDGKCKIVYEAYAGGGAYYSVVNESGSVLATGSDSSSDWVTITREVSIPESGVASYGLATSMRAAYYRNIKVIINVDPNAGGSGEATDFTGTYSFTSTKEITSTLEGDVWPTYLQAEFNFTITKNEGNDADVYPYLINEFPSIITGVGKATTNSLKAKPTADGTSLEMGIGHANKIYGTQDHEDLAGPNGIDDTAETLTISPIADSDNYTIIDGFQVIKHQDAFLTVIPESKRNLCKYTDIVITRIGDVDGINSIVADEKAEVIAPEGVYTINGAKIRNTNDASDLQPGFYIIGGKKVVIR
ncbi:MAG: hypothetical protein ACI308_06040 [Muribaculaceae bacterium]